MQLQALAVTSRRLRSKAFLIVLATMLLTMILAPLTSAGKEGVYISGDTYYTLEQVSFSSGTDTSLLKFVLRLHNGSNQDVDFNYFGARVTDSQGRSYSATQVNKQNARVLPGTEQDFQFTARTASSTRVDELNITLFAWDYGRTNYMRDLGSLSVAAAIAVGGVTAAEATVSLSQVDSALSTDATVTYRADQSYMVYQGNGWSMYTDLSITNPGSAAISLPSGLKYRLANPEGQQYAASVVQGGDQQLLSGTSRKLIIQTVLSNEVQAEDNWTLELYKGDSTGESLLGTIGLSKSGMSIPIGAEETLTGTDGKKLLTAVVESATTTKQNDQVLVQTTVRVNNPGTRMVTMPNFTAQVQMKSVDMAVEALQSGTAPVYLSPQSSTVFTYLAVLPSGISAKELQLVVVDKKEKDAANAEKQLPVLVADLDQSTEQNGVLASNYQVGDPLKLQSSKLVSDNLSTSLMEFNLYKNDNNGFETAVTKFKLTNHGTSTIALPVWGTELIGEDGLVYSGSLIKPALQQVAPNTSYMITYTYLVPSAKQEQAFTLHVYDGTTAPSTKITLGAYQLHFHQDEDSGIRQAFPYELNIKDSSLYYAIVNKLFIFEFKVDMDVRKLEQMLNDASTAKLQFDMVDLQDEVVSTQTLDFEGLKSGSQSVKFTNDSSTRFSDTFRVKIYELIETGSGTVKRLLADVLPRT